MFSVDVCKFNKDTHVQVQNIRHNSIDVGNNWPVVYILNNKKEAYVGETVNVARRMEQHWQNEERKCLTEVRIISDLTFNKSTILDLESFLIKYMSADGKYVLQNGNNGIQDHQYYQKDKYLELFDAIWKKLIKCGVASQSLTAIENSELYKYSPYKALGAEQIDAEKTILKLLSEYGNTEAGVNIVVRGGAGTGKTILAIYLIKLLTDINARLQQNLIDPIELLDGYINDFEEIIPYIETLNGLEKIGIVIPQSSLKASLKDVFKSVKGLDKAMVLSPAEVVKNYLYTGKKYDLLLVDESHRLKCRYRGHLSSYPVFDKTCKSLGLNKDTATELDWIMHCSRNQVLFRDELQTVRPCDIPGDDFRRIVSSYGKANAETALTTQWRCAGGNDYIDYLKNIFSGEQSCYNDIPNYDFRLFDDCDEMIRQIKEKNEDIGLCRVAAGYAWPWKGKIDLSIKDVKIQGHEYPWNSTLNNWISNPNSINEIGCIHTLQGYDLNYAGIIIGNDLKYDPVKQAIFADKDSYYDQQGKSGVANKPDELLEYLKNIYLTLLTRGVKGTYVYVCDAELKKYFEKFIHK